MCYHRSRLIVALLMIDVLHCLQNEIERVNKNLCLQLLLTTEPNTVDNITFSNSFYELVLEYTDISSISESSFADCSQLTSLKLVQNNIKIGIDTDGFAVLNDQNALTIRNNQLAELKDKTFPRLKNVRNLAIAAPRLYIKQSLKFPNLYNIDILAHHLEWPKFPDTLQNLVIHQTSVDFHQIKLIFKEMNQLQTVQLTKCGLFDLPNIESSTVKSLNLSDNQMITLPELHLISLKYLDISKNRLHKISTSMLRFIGQLQIFQAQHNQIVSIDEMTFSHHLNLTVINLTDNRLQTMKFEMLPRQITHILIDGNPFDCKWIQKIRKEHADLVITYAGCDAHPVLNKINFENTIIIIIIMLSVASVLYLLMEYFYVRRHHRTFAQRQSRIALPPLNNTQETLRLERRNFEQLPLPSMYEESPKPYTGEVSAFNKNWRQNDVYGLYEEMQAPQTGFQPHFGVTNF